MQKLKQELVNIVPDIPRGSHISHNNNTSGYTISILTLLLKTPLIPLKPNGIKSFSIHQFEELRCLRFPFSTIYDPFNMLIPIDSNKLCLFVQCNNLFQIGKEKGQ